jgi:hypothetical protein
MLVERKEGKMEERKEERKEGKTEERKEGKTAEKKEENKENILYKKHLLFLDKQC